MDEIEFVRLINRSGSIEELTAYARAAGMRALVRPERANRTWRERLMREALQDDDLRREVWEIIRSRPDDVNSDEDEDGEVVQLIPEAGELDLAVAPPAEPVAAPEPPAPPAMPVPAVPAPVPGEFPHVLAEGRAAGPLDLMRKTFAKKLKEPADVPVTAWRDFEIPEQVKQLLDSADVGEVPSLRLIQQSLKELAVPREQIRDRELHPILRKAAGKTDLAPVARLTKGPITALDMVVQATVAIQALRERDLDPGRQDGLLAVVLAAATAARSQVLIEATSVLLHDSKQQLQDLVPILETVQKERAAGTSAYWGSSVVGGLDSSDAWVRQRLGYLVKPTAQHLASGRGKRPFLPPWKRQRASEYQPGAQVAPAQPPSQTSMRGESTRGRGRGRGGGGGRGR